MYVRYRNYILKEVTKVYQSQVLKSVTQAMLEVMIRQMLRKVALPKVMIPPEPWCSDFLDGNYEDQTVRHR